MAARQFERVRVRRNGVQLRLVDHDTWAKTGRTLRLTPAGNRKAFEQSLERIMAHTQGVLR